MGPPQLQVNSKKKNATYLIVIAVMKSPCTYLPAGRNKFSSSGEHSRTKFTNSFISSKLGGGTLFDVKKYAGTYE